MSLQSCETCGRALSIVEARCRNCVRPQLAVGRRKTVDLKLALPAAIAAGALVLFLYEMLSR
jgi:hypothetical protein